MPQIRTMADAETYARECYEGGYSVVILDTYGREGRLALIGGPVDELLGRPDELGLCGHYQQGWEDAETQWYPFKEGLRQAAHHAWMARRIINAEQRGMDAKRA